MKTGPYLALLLLSLTPATTQAALYVWNGGDGDYSDGSNWDQASVPNTNGGDTAQITSGNVTYTAGPDLQIHGGGALVISGGSWTQAGGISWIQLGGGNLTVSGGTFNQGTAQNIVRNATTTIQITTGVANFNGNFLHDATNFGQFSITGGTVNIANEFKPLTTFTMSAGTLNANLISFADGPGSINFTGGTISVDGGNFYSGFYGGGSQSVNFSSGSTGSLFFANYSLAELASDGFLSNGTIQFNGGISPASFSAVESAGGVIVSAVPEPSTGLSWLASMGAFLLVRRRK